MKILFKIVLFFWFAQTIISCSPSSSTPITPARDRQEVYNEDILEIEDYLKSNYIEFDANNNATITKIPEGGTQTSIWNQYTNNDVDPFPSINVKNDTRITVLTDGRIDDNVDYKLYYIKLNEGGGQTPTQVDSTFVGYKGWNLSNVTFDENNSGTWFSYPDVNTSISGFKQILSTVKTAASVTENTNGALTYNNAGNVIVFIPSGLAYFNNARLKIDAYAPIVFQIKLYGLKERNHDADGVPSKYEDFSYDPVTFERIYAPDNDYFNDDTDGDKIPDFYDTDDDGDGYLTKYEIKKPTPFLGVSTYYPYNNDAFEPKGIPDASGDGTTTLRLRRHLDKTTKPPYTVY